MSSTSGAYAVAGLMLQKRSHHDGALKGIATGSIISGSSSTMRAWFWISSRSQMGNEVGTEIGAASPDDAVSNGRNRSL